MLKNKLATGKPEATEKSPPADTKPQAINGLMELEKNMDTLLLEFEEINSAIDKYLNNFESNDDKELLPRGKNAQRQCQTTNPKRVAFSKEPHGIYDTSATSGFGALEDAKYFISTRKIPTKLLLLPTATPCRKMKE